MFMIFFQRWAVLLEVTDKVLGKVELAEVDCLQTFLYWISSMKGNILPLCVCVCMCVCAHEHEVAGRRFGRFGLDMYLFRYTCLPCIY